MKGRDTQNNYKCPSKCSNDLENKKLKTERKLKTMSINYVKNDDLTVTLTMGEELFSEYFCFCADCGELIFIREAVRIDGEHYCHDCVCTCDICGKHIRNDDSYRTVDSDYDYCHDCFISETYRCLDCGERFRYEDDLHEVDDGWYCDDCWEDHKPIISDYHTMKDYGDIHFYGDESRRDSIYMGFELEIDADHRFNRESIAEELQSRFGDFLNYEKDSSILNGFEIISQPASLSYHMSIMPKYSDAFRYLLDNDIKSHDAGSCGLHIHLDRRYFGHKEDSSIAKLLYIFEKFRPELMRFSRRTEAQASDWARSRKQNYGGNGTWIKEAVAQSKFYSSYQNRYYAVNLCNNNTIELRLWRGTLNAETFEATLKFTARLAEICKYTRAVDLAKMTFEELLGSDEVILSYWNRINNK